MGINRFFETHPLGDERGTDLFCFDYIASFQYIQCPQQIFTVPLINGGLPQGKWKRERLFFLTRIKPKGKTTRFRHPFWMVKPKPETKHQ
jgi:hypothetical protein